MNQDIDAKRAFLEELDRKVEQSEEKARRFPDNQRATAMAQYMQALRDEVSRYSEDHPLFQNWHQERWAPMTVSDTQRFVRYA